MLAFAIKAWGVRHLSLQELMPFFMRQAVAPAPMPISLQELQALMRRSLAVEPQARLCKCFGSCLCMSGCMLAYSVMFAVG